MRGKRFIEPFSLPRNGSHFLTFSFLLVQCTYRNKNFSVFSINHSEARDIFPSRDMLDMQEARTGEWRDCRPAESGWTWRCN